MNLGSNTGGTATTRMIINTSGGVTIGGSDLALANDLFYVNGTSATVIDNSGNVGIGSLAPGQLLDVTGTIRTIGFTMSGNGILAGMS